MSLRGKLTLFMLVASLFPMLLYAGFAYSSIRDHALRQAQDTSAALFEAKLDTYEQKVHQLYNTAIDIISNQPLRFLFKSIRSTENIDTRSTFRKWQIISNTKTVQRTVDAHYAAQRDLLHGIGIYEMNRSRATLRNFETLKSGSLRTNRAALADSQAHVGVPRLTMSQDAGGIMYTVCLSFTEINTVDVLGTCMMDLNASNLFETLIPSALSESEELFILDSANRIVFHPDPSRIGTIYRDAGLLPSAEHAGARSYLARQRDQSFIVNSRGTATNPDWTVYYAVPYEYFVQSGHGMANMIIPFALLCAMMAIAFALLLSWNVYAPIRHLTRHISGMSGRNLEPLVTHSNMPEMVLLSDSFNALLDDIHLMQQQVEVEAEHAKKAEIIALRAQVSPHFLYNTLNVIKCLAAENRTDEIGVATTSLIDLLRASIGDTRDVVPLQTELGYVDNYITLQRYRLDLHFRYETHIDPDALDQSVPHFCLQPIVENALIHAFGDIKSEDNLITVRAALHRGQLIIEVEDTGDGIDPQLAEKLNAEFLTPAAHWMSKVGLHNVCERALHQLGPTATLTLKNTGKGTCVRLTLPPITYPSRRTTA